MIKKRELKTYKLHVIRVILCALHILLIDILMDRCSFGCIKNRGQASTRRIVIFEMS